MFETRCQLALALKTEKNSFGLKLSGPFPGLLVIDKLIALIVDHRYDGSLMEEDSLNLLVPRIDHSTVIVDECSVRPEAVHAAFLLLEK